MAQIAQTQDPKIPDWFKPSFFLTFLEVKNQRKFPRALNEVTLNDIDVVLFLPRLLKNTQLPIGLRELENTKLPACLKGLGR